MQSEERNGAVLLTWCSTKKEVSTLYRALLSFNMYSGHSESFMTTSLLVPSFCLEGKIDARV